MSSPQKMYKMELIEGKGRGMIATCPIKRGTLLLSEAPLFTVPGILFTETVFQSVAQRVRALSKEDQRLFFGLHNSYPGDVSPLIGITKTNGMPLGSAATTWGIFLECSRFNHSCIPNAQYTWNSASRRENIRACKDIEPGNEVTVCYLEDDIFTSPRALRQGWIKERFNFRCLCELCALSGQALSISDGRRKEIRRMDESVGDGILLVGKPALALQFCRRNLSLLGEEDINYFVSSRVYYDAFQVCVAHNDLARASVFAAMHVAAKKSCEGNDATGLEEQVSYIEHPERHRLAGLTDKWFLKKKFARTPGSDGFDEWLWSRAAG